MPAQGHGPALRLTEASGRCRLGQATSPGRMARGERRRLRPLARRRPAVSSRPSPDIRLTRFGLTMARRSRRSSRSEACVRHAAGRSDSHVHGLRCHERVPSARFHKPILSDLRARSCCRRERPPYRRLGFGQLLVCPDVGSDFERCLISASNSAICASNAVKVSTSSFRMTRTVGK